MAQNTFAKLVASPLPPNFKVTGPDSFLQALVKVVQVVIPGTFTGVIRGAVDPSNDQGLFYNTLQKVFKDWDTATGRYQPVTDLTLKEEKIFYSAGDDLTKGWVVLNGRAINSITGLTPLQKQVLESTFGVGGTLPDRKVLGAFTNLPANGAFSNITIDATMPAEGAIEALTFSNPATKTEAEALRDKTEELRGSTSDLRDKTVEVRDVAEQLLDSVRASANSTVTAYAKIWVGFPE